MGRGDLAKMTVFGIIGQCRRAVKSAGVVESNCRMVPTFISQPSIRFSADLVSRGVFRQALQNRSSPPLAKGSTSRILSSSVSGAVFRRCEVARADSDHLAFAF
jgi:hypothetical protein